MFKRIAYFLLVKFFQLSTLLFNEFLGLLLNGVPGTHHLRLNEEEEEEMQVRDAKIQIPTASFSDSNIPCTLCSSAEERKI